ncbi:MAG: glycerophosphodiester phosphodiesterase family protein [Candidatus Eiseniibacteriota bacterium]
MSPRSVALAALLALTFTGLVPARSAAAPQHAGFHKKTTGYAVADLFASRLTPYGIGHRGYGADAFDPSGPQENTLDAFHLAFREGLRVVELDLQRTADGKVVAFHDDFFPQDFVCVSALTYDELLARAPQVPLFGAVLNSSRHFGSKGEPGGIVFAEIKPPVPLCDGANTSEQAEASESALVAAVVDEIRRARMEDRVILNSGSPSILARAAEQAPEIARALTLNALQMLTPEQVCQLLPPGLCPVRIPKSDCGLEWYNIGPIARLPRYTSFPHFLGTARGCAGSTAVSLDRQVLLPNSGVAAALVDAVHGAGLEAIVWTVDTATEWDFMTAAGVDGITTNNIPLALDRQPVFLALAGSVESDTRVAQPAAAFDVRAQGLELRAAQDHSSGGGTAKIVFSLPDAGAARLELVDVAGRLVESAEVGPLGAGRHAFALGRDLASGVYLVRLTHPLGARYAKFAVVR